MHITFRGENFPVRREAALAVNGVIPWCIVVDGAHYQVSVDATDADTGATRFVRYSLRNPGRRTPTFLASRRYPLLLLIDGVAVRAWPQFVPRGTGAKTFMHPTLNRRVATERGPVWIFESTGHSATEGGAASASQKLHDVRALAAVWLGDVR